MRWPCRKTSTRTTCRGRWSTCETNPTPDRRWSATQTSTSSRAPHSDAWPTREPQETSASARCCRKSTMRSTTRNTKALCNATAAGARKSCGKRSRLDLRMKEPPCSACAPSARTGGSYGKHTHTHTHPTACTHVFFLVCQTSFCEGPKQRNLVLGKKNDEPFFGGQKRRSRSSCESRR
jgi:hypothetical protein